MSAQMESSHVPHHPGSITQKTLCTLQVPLISACCLLLTSQSLGDLEPLATICTLSLPTWQASRLTLCPLLLALPAQGHLWGTQAQPEDTGLLWDCGVSYLLYRCLLAGGEK